MKKIFLIALFCLAQNNAYDWELEWSDEFDSTNINPVNWSYDTGFSYNNELEYYTNRPENSTIKDGNLLIIARKEFYAGGDYTSARLKTQDLKSWTYGKFEARMKLPAGKGIWPAFWLLGESVSQIGWPKCGEIDIMEHINTESIICGTMHWDNGGHQQSGYWASCDVTQYHIYSVEWNADSIKWFLDGNKYFATNISGGINGTEELHLPFFIILNLAVGGDWPGNPDSTTKFPDTVFVDYVRVYKDIAVEENAKRKSQNSKLKIIGSKIYLEMTDAVEVELKLFDIAGRLKETIYSGTFSAGNYTFTPNIKTAGIYFVRLDAGDYKESKKLILLK